jgi:hypothetical protein
MRPCACSFLFYLSFLFLRSAVEASLDMKKFHRNETKGLLPIYCNQQKIVSLLGCSIILKGVWHEIFDLWCAADFSLLNLPKGKSLGRSKPATNS